MKKTFIIFLNLITGIIIFAQPIFALEATYPTIGGVGLPPNPTFTNYFLYFFNLALFVGMVAAAIVMIFAGARFLFSQGAVGQLERSKSEMFRALIGLAVLFGAILIVNAINSGINQTAIEDVHPEQYSGGLMLHYEGGTDANLTGDLGEVKKQINSISWLSSTNDLPRIYVFPQKDFQGTPVEVDNPTSASIAVGNSISFDWNIPGVYLYDDYDFKLKALKAPIAIVNSQAALGNVNEGGLNFKDKTASIKIVQPEKKLSNDKIYKYVAVLFTGDNYSGQCSWAMNDLKDIREVSTAHPEENKVRIDNGDTFEGIKKVGSIYVLKYDPDVASSGATLYNGTNCESKDADWDPATNSFKSPNYCDVGEYEKELKFSEQCATMPQAGDTILSAKLSDNTALIIKDKEGDCQLFVKPVKSDCVNSITYGLFNMENRQLSDYLDLRPAYFTLLHGK
jgi:hypothetical protein